MNLLKRYCLVIFCFGITYSIKWGIGQICAKNIGTSVEEEAARLSISSI